MRLLRIAAVCGVLTLSAAGCNEEQLKKGDAITRDANAIGQAISDLADSPAGALIPPGVRAIMELLGLGTAAAVVAWQKIRKDGILNEKQKLTLTTKAIVDGIERLGGNEQVKVKAAVREEMARRNIRDTGRQVVEELKTG